MLINDSMDMAIHNTMRSVIDSGDGLIPANGSLLSRIVAAYLGNINGARIEDVMKRGKEVNDKFDQMTTEAGKLVAKGILAEVDTARNVFKPIVARIHERYTENEAEVNLNAFTPNIVMDKLPEVVVKGIFSELVDQFADRDIVDGVNEDVLVSAMPEEIDVNELRAAFTTGMPIADASLAKLSEKMTASDLIRVYVKLFNQNNRHDISFLSIEETIFGFLMTRRFIRELPEGCNGNAEVIRRALNNVLTRLAKYYILRIRRRDGIVARGEIVADYSVENETHTVIVYGETYLKRYLPGGGTPEALVGFLMKNPNIKPRVDAMITEEAIKDNTRVYTLARSAAMDAMKQRRVAFTQQHLFAAINDIFVEIENGDDEAAKELLGTRYEANRCANQFVEQNAINEFTDVGDYLIRLLGAALIESDQHAICLRTINRLLRDNKDLEAREAAAIYVRQRITDWWSVNILRDTKLNIAALSKITAEY